MAGALVRWCVARCRGGGWASPGGCFPSLRGASGVRRCPSPGRPSSGAGSRGSATRVSRVRSARAWGPSAAPQRAPLRAGVARCGGGGRASPGGVPSTIVRGVWGQALSLPRLPAFWAGCWGPPPTCCGRGCVGVGARNCPLGLHALWGLHAAGVARGRPRGGGGLPPLRGAPGVRRCPSPGRPPSGLGSQGSATGVSRVQSVQAWGHSTGPTACALAGRHCSLWGWREGVPGGVPSTNVGGV